MKGLHLKTGNFYDIITIDGIDCTNERDGTRVVIYTNGDKTFVREYNEFINKFNILTDREYCKECSKDGFSLEKCQEKCPNIFS